MAASIGAIARKKSIQLIVDQPVFGTQVALIALNSSFKGKRTLTLEPNVSHAMGRLMDGHEGTPGAILRFPSKVVSRNHAALIGSEGRLYVQDTKSSSGTFVNGQRLSPQGIESQLMEVHEGDILKLGEDCEVNGVLHQCVIMRVSILNAPAPPQPPIPDLSSTDSQLNISNAGNAAETSYIDYSQDPQVRSNVENEFASIWTSLTVGMETPLRRISRLKNYVESQKAAEAQSASSTPKRYPGSLRPQPLQSPPPSHFHSESVTPLTSTASEPPRS
ncbi:hypothetical protein HDU97_003828 [Phlyctochytrium planicorne]|nr:hypothetical protein HDU97_003828 [Phlyctochytrium planicorne]